MYYNKTTWLKTAEKKKNKTTKQLTVVVTICTNKSVIHGLITIKYTNHKKVCDFIFKCLVKRYVVV